MQIILRGIRRQEEADITRFIEAFVNGYNVACREKGLPEIQVIDEGDDPDI